MRWLWRDYDDGAMDGIVLMEMMAVRGQWTLIFWYPPLRNCDHEHT